MAADKSRSILIVDDDPGILDFITQSLEGEGYQVSGAANGEDGLAIMRDKATRPCLVLLDMAMPIMNGWEFRKSQLNDDALRTIPVIVLTADRQAAEKAADLQADGFLEKPLGLTTLLDIVKRYCSS